MSFSKDSKLVIAILWISALTFSSHAQVSPFAFFQQPNPTSCGGGLTGHNGYCYVYSSGISCNTACSNASLTYDDIGTDWANASTSNCYDVIEAIGGVPGTTVSTGSCSGYAFGCYYSGASSTRKICQAEGADGTAQHGLANRVCACQ